MTNDEIRADWAWQFKMDAEHIANGKVVARNNRKLILDFSESIPTPPDRLLFITLAIVHDLGLLEYAIENVSIVRKTRHDRQQQDPLAMHGSVALRFDVIPTFEPVVRGKIRRPRLNCYGAQPVRNDSPGNGVWTNEDGTGGGLLCQILSECGIDYGVLREATAEISTWMATEGIAPKPFPVVAIHEETLSLMATKTVLVNGEPLDVPVDATPGEIFDIAKRVK